MKIGIDASFLRKPGTGIGQVTVSFLKKLQELPIQNHSFVLYTEEKTDLTFPENFKVCSFLPWWWKRDDMIRKMLWERELAKRAKDDDCDIFLSLYQSSTVIQNFPRMRHIMVVHDIIPKLFPEYLNKWTRVWHWGRVERGIACADHIVAVSDSTRNDLEKLLSVDSQKISVVSPGASSVFDQRPLENEVQRVLAKYHLEPGYVYHGGGLEIRKNTEMVLRSYARLREEKLQVTLPKLVISGQIHARGNTLATDVVRLIRELALENDVSLIGFVPEEDLPMLYAGACCFFFPSRYEGFGIPPLEAMKMGCPVVVSDVSSLPEVCGEAALYCDPDQIESCRDALERLLLDERLREILRENGLIQSEKFSYDLFVRHIFDVMEKTI